MTKNIAASVKQQLLNLSRSRDWDFNWLLSRYANERFLYRISQSSHVDQLILKGAFLFIYWGQGDLRPTRDIDLLGYDMGDAQTVHRLFVELCTLKIEVDDGLYYDPDSVRVTLIQQDQKQHGYRVHLVAYLGKARVRVQIDVGTGDIVTPAPTWIKFPTLLNAFPAPFLRAYSQEVTIAEKVHAMIDKGLKNSRIKDFYDLWMLSQHYSFSGHRLTLAMQNTFQQKKLMPIPEKVLPLEPAFAGNREKQLQWQAFMRKGELMAPDFPDIIAILRGFLSPPLQSIREGKPFEAYWLAGGPWRTDIEDEFSYD